ncbi:tRNA (guanosine(37)-N1)-methyltransferase TrmD [Tundrisphaera lichenicola]|uniref:tRNA (guanosine(37)-N1)-methyltransferase TrmD n=1 Tax=Tundrisphaera lichenicola TaxID=2029860 RepID=UPI003EC05A34
MAEPTLRIDVLTLFPALFDGFLGESILRRAIDKGLVEVRLWNLRDWAEGKHRQVDDRPFGGGPGMVLMAPPVVSAVETVQGSAGNPGRLIALTPSGRTLSQNWVRELALEGRLVLLCGRYEGFDERVFEILGPELLSIGDYVLSGGEVAAMVVIDAVMRLIPGVLGDAESAMDESFGPEGGLEYPHYTRPREYRERTVPVILLGGDHAAIDRWRREQARGRTLDRRSDLLSVPPTRTDHPPHSYTLSEHVENHQPPGSPGTPDRAERKDGLSHAE